MFTKTDQALLMLARRQYGILTRQQALASGLTPRQVDRRQASGFWEPVAAGVYLIGGSGQLNERSDVGVRRRAMAATLHIPTAVASHETAGLLLAVPRLVPGAAWRTTVTVTPGTTSRSSLARVHEYVDLRPSDTVSIDGIPTTSLPLTVYHLACIYRRERVGRMIDDLIAEDRMALDDLHALAERWIRWGRRCEKVMRPLLLARGPGYVATESEAEDLFLRNVIQRNGLPEPVRQFRAPWLEPIRGRTDFAYPWARLVMEVDSLRWHSQVSAMTSDRKRDRAAAASGYLVMRIGVAEMTGYPDDIAADIRSTIDQRTGEMPQTAG